MEEDNNTLCKSSSMDKADIDSIYDVADDDIIRDEKENTLSEMECENSSEDEGDEVIMPEVGMHFSSELEVRKFYNSYAKRVGFGIAKLSSKKVDGKPKYFPIGCSKSGKAVTKGKNTFYPRPQSKTDCKAKINVTIQSDDTFVITSFRSEHNHDLSPGKSRFFRNNKVLNPRIKRKLEMNDQSGIGVSKTFQSLVVESGGYENLEFDERKCRNYVAEARKLRLGVGDAEALTKYFSRMQSKNSNFFHVIDSDDDLRVRNIFWSDARCRAAFECFSDVVVFDTTYLTNCYDMPFAPFVGVNHHGESILLGCGLLSKEDSETFTWLFKSWISCMGHAPKAIITDQCKAMEIAITEVFPDTHHRLCIWHIMKKIPEKLSSYDNYERIRDEMKNIVYDSLTTEIFDLDWARMIQDFNLEKNVWLNSIYEKRHKWIPAYVKDKFWAGMSASQRSESMNAFFDDYVNSKTTLKQFVEQYDSALRCKVAKEKDSDFSSFNSMFPVISTLAIEKQFQNVYTNGIFKLFQDEVRALMYCNASLVKQEGSDLLFEVLETKFSPTGKSSKEVAFHVQYNESQSEVKCLCRLFEFRGILCRHVISVFMKNRVFKVPERYILDRWRKGIKRGYQSIENIYDELGIDKEERRRYNSLCPLLYEVQELGSKSDKKFSILVDSLEDAKKRLMDVDKNDNVSAVHQDENKIDGSQVESQKLRSPLKVRSRGRPPSKRKQSTVEKIVKKAEKKSKKVRKNNSKEEEVGKT